MKGEREMINISDRSRSLLLLQGFLYHGYDQQQQKGEHPPNWIDESAYDANHQDDRFQQCLPPYRSDQLRRQILIYQLVSFRGLIPGQDRENPKPNQVDVVDDIGQCVFTEDYCESKGYRFFLNFPSKI